MQILRTIGWALLTALIVAFIIMNWEPSVRINLVPDSGDAQGYDHLTGPLGVVVLLAFLAGLVPSWLVAKARRWRLHRRIASLESAARAATLAASPTPAAYPSIEPALPVTDRLPPESRDDPVI